VVDRLGVCGSAILAGYFDESRQGPRRCDQESVSGAVPVDVYWQLIEKTLTSVRELKDANADADTIQETLGDLASEFSAISAVDLTGDRRLPLDSGYLVTRLIDPAPDLASLEAYLMTVQAARDRWPDPSHDNQDLVPVAEILARQEFQVIQEEPGLIGQLWDRITNWLLELLIRIYPQSAGGLGPLIRVALTVIGMVALIVALVFTMRGVLADIVAEEESLTTDDEGLSLISADQALDRAHAYSKGGDYRSAVRYLYISSLLLLEERELLRYDRTQTNQEYLRSVAGKPELAVILRDVIDVFDRVWYGFQSLDEAAFSHYAGQVEQLRQQQ
jgi:hypothetical protein